MPALALVPVGVWISLALTTAMAALQYAITAATPCRGPRVTLEEIARRA